MKQPAEYKKPVIDTLIVQRVCLRCRCLFPSESRFNRLCHACKHSVDYLEGREAASVTTGKAD